MMMPNSAQYITNYELDPLPDFVVDRNGLRVQINSKTWHLNTAGYDSNSLNLGRVKNPLLHYIFSKYLIFQLERKSPISVLANASCILTQLSKAGFLDDSDDKYPEEIEHSLIEVMNNILDDLRTKNKVSDFYDICRWYMWSADNFCGYGFNSEYALHLSRIKIPGELKGEAVRSRDPEEGPLHFELEEPLVRRAMTLDKSDSFKHKQQRLAVALCLAFGRNPLNYVRLREDDFINLTADFPNAQDVWQLRIPRIKKRSSPRELFKTETCEVKLAEMIEELILENQKISTELNGHQMPRPLFIRKTAIPKLIGTDSEEYAFHCPTSEFLQLVSDWAKRMRLISPISNKALRLTPRRLRYTFACNMARQGVSRVALAEMLDHTDTQHVGVYFELFDELVGMLDKALALKIGPVLGWFKGKVVGANDTALNAENSDKQLTFFGERNPNEKVEIGVCGEVSLCHLDPPYSCYLCPKFQPYLEADHERVLDIMLSDRNFRLEKYKKSKLGIQLDDVIYAVAEAAFLCAAQKK